MNKTAGFLKSLLTEKKGEIATILTVATLGLMLIGTFVGTKLAEKSTEQRTEAKGFGQLQTQTLNGCEIVPTDQGPGCSCAEGGWQFHCFGADDPNAKRGGTPSDLCKSDCGKRNGMVKPPDGPGGQPGASCTLTSQDPNVGNCCTTCIARKRPDLRTFFNSNGWSVCSDTQIVNNWCNGISSQATNDCKTIREGDCKTECSKDQSTCQATGESPQTGGTAGTPAPPAPGGPGSPGGGRPKATATPDPAGTYGNYVVIDQNTVVHTQYSSPTPAIDTYEINISEDHDRITFSTPFSVHDISKLELTPTTDYVTSIDKYKLKNAIIRKIDQKVPTDLGNFPGIIQAAPIISGNPFPRIYYYNIFQLCNPYGKNFAEPTLVPTITAENVIKSCSGQNVFDLDLDNADLTPTPSPPSGSFPYGFYIFKVQLTDETNTLNDFKINAHDDIQTSGIISGAAILVNGPEFTFKNISSSPRGTIYESDPLIYQLLTDASDDDKMTPRVNYIRKNDDLGNYVIYTVKNMNTLHISPCFPNRNIPVTAPTIEPTNAPQSPNCTTYTKELVYDNTSVTVIPSGGPTITPGGPTLTPTPLPPLVGSKGVNFEITLQIQYTEWNKMPSTVKVLTDISLNSGISILSTPYTYGLSDFLDIDKTGHNIYKKDFTHSVSSFDLSSIDSFSENADVFKIISTIIDSNSKWCHNKTDSLTITKEQIRKSTNNPMVAKLSIFLGCFGTAEDSSKIISITGSSNEAFRMAMDRWVKGELNVLQMSSFISQLTRAPGLQISYCDPRKGECNF